MSARDVPGPVDATVDDPNVPRADADLFASRLQAGQAIGRYRVGSRVGSGAMGVVYLAHDPELGRSIALKLLHGSARADAGSGGHNRLLREAQALARLAHPNVVTIHDVGEHEGLVFLAMEFVRGTTLTEWVQARKRSWQEVVSVFIEAGRGLAAAHAEGLVHRDFKPDNVMVDDASARGGRRVLVMDFGLARSSEAKTASAPEDTDPVVTDALSSNMTRQGSVLGTPAYMAPEQHRSGTVGPAADQFSFCVSLYEALFGERPFRGGTAAAVALSIISGEMRPIPPGRVPAHVRRAIRRGLSVDEADRWPSMGALIAQLEGAPGRRRLLVGIGLVGTTAALVVGGRWYAQRQALAECDAAAVQIREHFDPDRRRAIASGFEAIGRPYATQTWPLAQVQIDRYLDAWETARRQACIASEIEHTRAPALHAQAVNCLARKRAQLVGLLGSLQEPSNELVLHAVQRVGSLTPPQACVDDKHLALAVPLPDDARLRAKITRAQLELVEITAMSNAEEIADAEQASVQVLERIAEIGWPPLVAEGHLVRGRALADVGRHDEAATHLEKAFHLATEGSDDFTAFDAAMSLVWVVGYRLAKAERGLEWSRIAQSLVKRLGAFGQLRHAELLDRVGVVHLARGAFEEALTANEQALEIRRAAQPQVHPEVAVAWHNISNARHALGRYEPALEAGETARDIWQETLGPEHPDVAKALGAIGNALVALERNDEALAAFERAEAVLVAAGRGEHPSVLAIVNGIALAQTGLDRADAALSTHARGLKIARAALGPRHPDVAMALTGMASLYSGKGEHEKAVQTLQEAGDIWKASLGDGHPNVGVCALNLATALRALGRYDEALTAAQSAIDTFEEALGPEHPNTGMAWAGLAAVHSERGAPEQALTQYDKALQLLEAALGPEHPDLAGTLVDLSGLHEQLGHPDKAATFAARGRTVAEKAPGRRAELARARYQWARTAVSDPDRRAEAIEQAKVARALLADDPGNTGLRRRIDTWLHEQGEAGTAAE